MLITPLFGASALPVFAAMITVVVVVLYFLACKYGRTLTQRIMNLCFELAGCVIVFAAWVQLDNIPRFKWFTTGVNFLIVPLVAMSIGTIVGLAVSIILWKFFSLLVSALIPHHLMDHVHQEDNGRSVHNDTI